MNLIDALGWAVVELQSPNPDLNAVRAALEKAYISAANLDLRHEVAKDNFIRLAKSTGGL